MDRSRPIHLKARDRFAFAYRVAGALAGLTLIAWTFATSSWDNTWTITLVVLITVGGALSYHLLTSVARCPQCGHGVTNFRIGADDAKQKAFRCGDCGASAYLTEGFYWQRDISG